MDQVRLIVKTLWQQRFWVLSVVGSLAAVVCWSLASSDLDKEFKTRKSSIEGSFKKMNDLDRKPVHYNPAVNEGETAQLRAQGEHVLNVWRDLYQQQREKVLYWPKDHLEQQFITEIEKLQFRDSFPARHAEFMRDNYYNYIEKRFDGLLEIVKAKKTAVRGTNRRFAGEGRGREGRGGGRDDLEEDDDYLVLWLDQEKVQSQLAFKTKPSALQIWVTQEDLWVYETLLNVIANTNKKRNATRPDNTAIRAIVALEVGASAARTSQGAGNIIIPQSSEAGVGGGEFGGYGGEMGGEYGGRGMGGEGAGGEEYGGESYGGEGYGGESYGGEGYGGARGGGALAGTALLERRYLDENGDPHPAETESFGTTFRRLPIRMVLEMDQRWIPQLLIECANAALPVETKQLRINPGKSGVMAGMRGGGGRRRGRGLDSLESDPAVGEVELHGVVFIYKKPDEAQINLPEIEDDQVAAVPVDSAQR